MFFLDNKPYSQAENINDYLKEITGFVLPLKKKSIASKWKLLTSVLENQKLCGGVFQTPEDTAFQNTFVK